MFLFSNRLQKVKENGKTYLVHKDTSEKIQIWSDEVRASQAARKKRGAPTPAFKIGSVKYSAHEEVTYKKCDARVNGKLCNNWEVVHPKEHFLKGKFRCYECLENDNPVTKSPAKKAASEKKPPKKKSAGKKSKK